MSSREGFPEARLQRLEEENYFLRRRLEELDEAFTLQQRQLDDLEKSLARTTLLLVRVQEELRLSDSPDLPANEPPPHYNSW